MEQIDQANDRLVELRENEVMLNRYLSIASHDIRAPLQVILSACELFRDESEALNEQQLEYVDFIEQSGRRILTMVEEMLDKQQIEEKGVPV